MIINDSAWEIRYNYKTYDADDKPVMAGNREQFEGHMEKAKKFLDEEIITACLRELSLAEQIHGFENDPQIIRLEEVIDQFYERKGIHKIYAVPDPEPLIPDEKGINYFQADPAAIKETPDSTVAVSVCNPVTMEKAEGVILVREVYDKKIREGKLICGSFDIPVFHKNYFDGIFDLAFSKDGKNLLIVGDSHVELRSAGDGALIWKENDRKPAGSARSTFDYYNQGYNGAFAENGRFFMINDRIWMIRYNYSEVKKPGAENHQSQA